MNGKNDLCDERHQIISEKLLTQDKRLNIHGNRLDKLEQHKSKVDVQIENLIEKINDLIGTIKWFLFGIIASGGSFIIWQIKEMVSK